MRAATSIIMGVAAFSVFNVLFISFATVRIVMFNAIINVIIRGFNVRSVDVDIVMAYISFGIGCILCMMVLSCCGCWNVASRSLISIVYRFQYLLFYLAVI